MAIAFANLAFIVAAQFNSPTAQAFAALGWVGGNALLSLIGLIGTPAVKIVAGWPAVWPHLIATIAMPLAGVVITGKAIFPHGIPVC